jgi:hypothetical protein
MNLTIIGKDYSGRDYYIGAMRRRGEVGMASVHISRMFQAENDNYNKFAISAPVHDSENPGSPPLGVIAAAIATNPTLGYLELNNPWLTAVLIDRMDPNPPRGPSPVPPPPDKYLIVVHPAYLRRQDRIEVDKNSLRFSPEQAMNRDYKDPLAAQYQMLAGFTPVGTTKWPTPLLVIVQQRYDQAIEQGKTLVRDLILWGGIFLSLGLFLGTIITGAPRPGTSTRRSSG